MDQRRIIYPLTAPLLRLRHWRGKGVHSPFMYGMVREVFLPKEVSGRSRGLYNEACRRNIRPKDAVVLQNLSNYYKAVGYVFLQNGKVQAAAVGRNICIVNSPDEAGTVIDAAEMLAGTDSVLVWLIPDSCRKKKTVTAAIYKKHHCVVADCCSMVIIFFDNKLNRQKYLI